MDGSGAVAWRRDIVVAVAFAALAVLILATGIDEAESGGAVVRSDDVWMWLGNLAVCATLVFRRRAPLASATTAAGLFLALDLSSYRDDPAFFALLVSFYAIGALATGRRVWLGPALTAAVAAAVTALGPSGSTAPNILLGASFLLGAWMFGRLVAARRARLAAEADRARAAATAEMRADELALSEERLRIARELHDVVAHAVSVIAVQAGVGLHLVERQPDEALRALDNIAATSATTSNELTRLLGVLRAQPGDADASDGHQLESPSLARLTELVASVRAAGVTVDERIDDDLSTVPDGLGRALYRVAQEALTNVIKHAGLASVTLAVRVDADSVALDVEDDGRGAAAPRVSSGSGQGLPGMHDRVALYGGTLDAGPRPGGGFAVRARLPLAARALSDAPEPIVTASAASVPELAPRRRGITRWDVLFAAAVAATIALATTVESPDAGARGAGGAVVQPNTIATLAVTAAPIAALVWRRVHPIGALAVATVALGVVACVDRPTNGLPFVVTMLTYGVARYTPRPRSAVAAGTALALLWLTLVAAPADLTPAAMAFITVLVVVAFVFGAAGRHNAEALETLVAQTTRIADAERHDAAAARTQRRLELAWDVHDVVVDAIGVIRVHAAAGAAAMCAGHSSDATEALTRISQRGRSALADLRDLLGVLRADDGTRAHLARQGIDQLPTLAAAAADAGLMVRVNVTGSPHDVPPAIDLSAFRIVQQAISNVLQHAGPATADVAVDCRPDAVRIEVVDDGRGAAARRDPAGRGVTIMHERAALFGGSLHAGPRAGGGFAVHALLPYELNGAEAAS